eukprot:SAG31_NODE_463_length_15332_cov_5.907700_4_plen_1357_part_00
MQCAPGTHDHDYVALIGTGTPSVRSLPNPATSYMRPADAVLPSCLRSFVPQASTPCEDCAAGRYMPNPGQFTCLDCNAGEYSSAGSSVCDPCGEGTYDHDSSASTECVDCDPGNAQPETGQTSCDPCSEGTAQSLPGQSSCDDCVAGQFTNTTGQSSCLLCAVGRFNPSTGLHNCSACAPGQYQASSGQSSCIDCDPGQYTSTEEQVACQLCGDGTFASSAGSVECGACEAGNETQLADGSFASLAAVACVGCSAGRYSSDTNGATECQDCIPGSQTADSSSTFVGQGAVACLPCTAGRYGADATGALECAACTAGNQTVNASGSFVNGTVGQNAAVSCVQCVAGRYTDAPGHQCTPCDPGNAQPETGQTSCDPCSEGTAQSLPGQSSCDDCVAGQFTNTTGQSSCLLCAVGRFNPSTGLHNCSACAPGQYQASSGQSSCIDCDPGQYTSTEEQVACQLCGDGTFASSAGSVECGACEAGNETQLADGSFASLAAVACVGCSAGRYSSDTNGATECQDCIPGSQTADSSSTFVGQGAVACLPCTAGRYGADATGALECAACTAGNQTVNASGSFVNESAVVCSPCAIGRYGVDPSHECIPCAAGTHGSVPGQTSCTDCPPGRYVETTGSLSVSSCINCDVGKYSTTAGNANETSCQPCRSGRYMEASGSVAAADCIPCGIGRFNPANGSAFAENCSACSAGRYQPAIGSSICLACVAGSQTTASAGGVYVENAAVSCDECLPGQYSADPSGALACQLCGPGNMTTNSTIPAIAMFVAVGAMHCTPCAGGPSVTNLSTALNAQHDLAGARGYADLDSSSATACHPCVVGTYAAADGVIECIDFDECASTPCENGASCEQPTLEHPTYFGSPGYACTCAAGTGFSGERCELLDECSLDPCKGLTTTTPPEEPQPWPSAQRSSPATDVFLCPAGAQISCVDPESAVTDNYICSCPACADFVFTDATVDQLREYFSTHPGSATHLLAQVAEAQALSGRVECAARHLQGCTDSAAYNYDPSATHDDDSCVPRVYGCTDPLAINFDPAANTYDSTGFANELCKAVLCAGTSDPPHCPEGWDGPRGGLCSKAREYTSEGSVQVGVDVTPWVCGAGQALIEFGPTNECVGAEIPSGFSRCDDPRHRLCVIGTGSSGYVAPSDCNNFRRTFECAEAAQTGFTCTDPNPYWPNDYICGCAANVSTAQITNGRRIEYTEEVEASCGRQPLFAVKSARGVDGAWPAAVGGDNSTLQGDGGSDSWTSGSADAVVWSDDIPACALETIPTSDGELDLAELGPSLCGTFHFPNCNEQETAYVSRVQQRLGGICSGSLVLTNYELSLYLASRSSARRHLCRSLGNPSPDCDV